MEIILYFITGIIGAVLPYFLTRRLELDTVKASALPSLIVGIIFYSFPVILSSSFHENIPFLFFGASFVGMVNKKILHTYVEVSFAGIIFTILYLNASSFFNGFGGALGTAACISVLTIFGIKKIKTLLRFFSIRRKN